ncbi:LysR family transcriptional regulator [Entomohabitans teleogrylli]|uniref:LysR family transcriptional regulator n=1 Tax=Entomohabitans teleogrylli TaxID=1384589 RepID=UPI00073D45B3|nr:LysR substrate-binding domain-containing protein [Entomohabitans teleogrylli]
MDIADLRMLIAVVDNGSITGAARTLNRVPSGVTTRLLQLEATLGVALFLREKRRLVVTPKGRLMYQHARRILEMMREAEQQVTSAEPAGKLRIGAMESTAAVRLPEPLARLHQRYPGLALELTTGTSRWLYEQLLDNQLDAIFAADIGSDEITGRAVAFEEQLVLIAPAAHPPVRDPHDIAGKTLLTFREGCSYRTRFIGWFQSGHLEPGNIVDLASYHAIMGGVAAGMGVGIVPAAVLALFPDKRTLSVHALPPTTGDVTTEIIWRNGMGQANILALQACLRPDSS